MAGCPAALHNWLIGTILGCSTLLSAMDLSYRSRADRSSGEVGVTWTETFNCDICGKPKGSVDHWWLAWNEACQPHREAKERHMLKIYPWDNMMAHDANAKHLCGQACLQKFVDRWMNSEMSHIHSNVIGIAQH